MCDFKDDEQGQNCKCRRAVMTAYNGLRDASLPDSFALDAATRVYRHHHPEDTKEMSRLKVESWIHAGHLH